MIKVFHKVSMGWWVHASLVGCLARHLGMGCSSGWIFSVCTKNLTCDEVRDRVQLWATVNLTKCCFQHYWHIYSTVHTTSCKYSKLIHCENKNKRQISYQRKCFPVPSGRNGGFFPSRGSEWLSSLHAGANSQWTIWNVCSRLKSHFGHGQTIKLITRRMSI